MSQGPFCSTATRSGSPRIDIEAEIRCGRETRRARPESQARSRLRSVHIRLGCGSGELMPLPGRPIRCGVRKKFSASRRD